MKVGNLNESTSYHDRCVCQICTCHKHRCPHSQAHLPLGATSSYNDDFHPHDLNPWQKPPPESRT